MRKSRIRLTVTIFVVIVYMISALSWWAFALIRFQETQFKNEIETIQTKEKLAIQKIENWVLRERQNVQQNKSKSVDIKIDNRNYKVDTVALKAELNHGFEEFYVFFVTLKQHNMSELCLKVKPEIILRLESTLLKKKRAWIGEGLTLGFITVVICIAMFVYLDKIISLNTQQNNFLLAVTHELKTPISATRLALQTIEKDKAQKFLPKMIEMANSNILRLSQMVDQILMATRFESKFNDPVFSDLELFEFVKRTLVTMELPQSYKDRLEVNISEDIQVSFDELMFATVIRNLVTNAFKYSEDSGKVKIKVDQLKNGFVLMVSDEGIGINDSEKKKVFEKFYRVGDEKTRTKPGSGLGLYLVKKITEIHGGTVSIEDNEPNGTIFKLSFLNYKLN